MVLVFQEQYSRAILHRFVVQKSHLLAQEYIDANNVIAFCPCLMNKMRRNLKYETFSLANSWCLV